MFGEELVAKNIEDLKGAFAVDDDVAVADEGKRLIGFADVLVCGEHQLEAALIVRRLCGEGVGGWPFDRLRDQQVHIRAC